MTSGSKIKLLFLFIILFSAATAVLAQPGGGGGLQIGALFNNRLDSIDILNDTSLQIRTFVLRGNKVYQETFLHEAFLENNGKMRLSRGHYGFGLPPTSDVNGDGYSDRQSNQRMIIVHGKDMMMIDFIGIMGENGAGYTEQMDSLVIKPGYFTYYLKARKGSTYDYNEWKKVSEYIHHGFTSYTLSKLSAEGYLQFEPGIDLSFLQKDALPASYYFKRAGHYIKTNNLKAAFSDIANGIQNNKGIANCEVLYLLTEAYAATNQLEKAIENISLAIDCKRYNWNSSRESKVQNYETRVQLFTKLGKYDKALEDLNRIAAISEDTIGTTIARADYKVKYLKDYSGARNDLQALINSIPANHLVDHPQGPSEYGSVYFELGSIEYQMGDITAAVNHWLKSEEFGYSISSSEITVLLFDSIISQHPQVAALYLCRALAQYKRGPFLGWGDQTNNCFEKALADVNKAEHQGMIDYRINLYRAKILTLLKRYDDAIKEIDIAILKNNTDPRCYISRSEIRSNLGLTKWGDNNDLDYVQYLYLSKQWHWER